MITYKEIFRLDAIESKAQLKGLMPLFKTLQQHNAAFYEGKTDEPLMGYEEEMFNHLAELVNQYVYDHIAVDIGGDV